MTKSSKGTVVTLGEGASEAPLTIEDVLVEEVEAIYGPNEAGGQRKLSNKLYELDSAALCLSGGGIRSAAFALGVIQALATHPRPVAKDVIQSNDHIDKPENSLLGQFHYLSTVSGGGYIGSWLSAWISRASFPIVWSRLVSRAAGPELEPPTLAWLRSYSNYLTPKLGLMSADTWAAIALFARNMLLNWLVIIPPLCALLIVVKLIPLGMFAIHDLPLAQNQYNISEKLVPLIGNMQINAFTLLFFFVGAFLLVLGLGSTL